MVRREFLKQSSLALVGATAIPRNSKAAFSYPVKKITEGGKQHWFGYYDKHQIDPAGRYALGMEAGAWFRSPGPDDVVIIGLIDLHQDFTWRPLHETRAWGWQQGCMLQWIPGSDEEIIWNDRESGRFVSRIMNIRTGEIRTLPKAVYTLSSDGQFALGTTFERIQNMRPGYGYAGVPDPFEQERAPEAAGIYFLDLKTGRDKLIVSLKQMALLRHGQEDLAAYWHYFNHLLIAPGGRRFVFLHRWRKEMGQRSQRATGGFVTRMVTADCDGNEIFVVDPSGNTSHFIWKDGSHICAWTRPDGKRSAFYLFQDKTNRVEAVGEDTMVVNGHNTYVPNTGQDWILNDTYPQGNERLQELYLYHVPSGKKVILGRFHEPPDFNGEWRCDLHPRCDQQGTGFSSIRLTKTDCDKST